MKKEAGIYLNKKKYFSEIILPSIAIIVQIIVMFFCCRYKGNAFIGSLFSKLFILDAILVCSAVLIINVKRISNMCNGEMVIRLDRIEWIIICIYFLSSFIITASAFVHEKYIIQNDEYSYHFIAMLIGETIAYTDIAMNLRQSLNKRN